MFGDMAARRRTPRDPDDLKQARAIRRDVQGDGRTRLTIPVTYGRYEASLIVRIHPVTKDAKVTLGRAPKGQRS